ncbi:cell division protein SepF [Candidatus Micrarchaeota archaeon]|jgi:hypothetical protein|nr:cell division protein SepF [Candidatus Micrarchaeota archaeon]
MGLFEKISGGLGLSKSLDLEEYMDTVEMDEVDVLHEPADFYVKPIALEKEEDVTAIVEELKARNIVLLNVSKMSKWPNKLKASVGALKKYVSKVGGDIARIDNDKILLTPGRVKIVKKLKKR